ncbi:hypothetical protein B566_EDAN018346 [Ephemera danica]|nr:hypothetical protein B566_EDAN018346 [Ephemera danica]
MSSTSSAGRHVTQRNEADAVEILSGVYEGLTTGTPICLLIRNTDQRSKDYGNILDTFRPGHADYTYWRKYGLRDPRGGGRSSARLTAPMVAAGAVAKKWLKEKHGTTFAAWLTQLGELPIAFEGEEHIHANAFFAANASQVPAMEAYMDDLRRAGDSCGARLAVVARGVPVGLGEPLYDKLDAEIAYAMMGINAVKGVEIGDGFGVVAQRGSAHGDELSPEGFRSNHSGGVLGGISTGQELRLSIAIKPTSSIRTPKASIDRAGQPTVVETFGRHDPCVGLRAAPIAQAMLALVLMDHALRHRAQCADVALPLPPIAGQAPPQEPGTPSLGLSTLAIGAFASLQSWTRVLAPYAWGWLADHGHGRVKLLRVGAALSVLGCVALLLLPGYGTVALAVAVAWLFLSNGGISPLGEAVVIKHLHDGDGLNAKAYSRIRVWGSVGFIVSVVGAGNVLQRVEISALPWLTLGAFLSLYLVIGRLPDEPAAPAHQAQRAAVLPVLRRRPVAWFFAGTMLTVLAHTGQYAFFSLFLKDLGYSKSAIGLMWAASVAAEIGFFLLAGRYFARVNDLRWLQFAALAAAARFSLTAAVGSVVWVLVLLQALHALTFSGHHMACTSALGRYFPEALRGRGSALYSTLGYGVPGVVGGLAGGALSQAFGLAAVQQVVAHAADAPRRVPQGDGHA